jgi:hypothetical protein
LNSADAALGVTTLMKGGNIHRMDENANLPAAGKRAAETEAWHDPITYKGRSLLEYLNTNIGQIPDHEALALQTLHMKGTLADAIDDVEPFADPLSNWRSAASL